MKKAMKRPDLSTGEGCIIDPGYLSKEVRSDWDFNWLRRSPLTAPQRSAYLDAVNDRIQIHDLDLTPAATEQGEIERVRSEARRLRAAIEAMGKPAREMLQAHTDFLAFGSAPPAELPDTVAEALRHSNEGDFLATVWDWTRGVEVGAEYAGQQFRATRGDKPVQHSARALVTRLAEAYRCIAGEWPPSDRVSWFAYFAQVVWDHVFPKNALKIGARLLDSGIKQAKKNTLIDQKS